MKRKTGVEYNQKLKKKEAEEEREEEEGKELQQAPSEVNIFAEFLKLCVLFDVLDVEVRRIVDIDVDAVDVVALVVVVVVANVAVCAVVTFTVVAPVFECCCA
ncbi:Hypothetical predicted protein [Octopus vulgaris]|uniref:Uncharacterized protein n=1 Tax=Octopus vulgaris TaxID=6645 RepID=A0AA36AMW8_OCTVU|nr:Hypothetical predicted protein [Octopus vulgaris]